MTGDPRTKVSIAAGTSRLCLQSKRFDRIHHDRPTDRAFRGARMRASPRGPREVRVSRPTEETFAMRGRARATFDRAVPCLRTRVCGDVGVNQLVKVPFLEPRGFRFLTPPNQGLRTVDVSGRGVGAIHDSASALCRAGSVARFPSAQPTKGSLSRARPTRATAALCGLVPAPVRDRFGLHGRRGARARREAPLRGGGGCAENEARHAERDKRRVARRERRASTRGRGGERRGRYRRLGR